MLVWNWSSFHKGHSKKWLIECKKSDKYGNVNVAVQNVIYRGGNLIENILYDFV